MGEWIKVSERLPEDCQEVLVCAYNSKLKFHNIKLDCYNGYGKWQDLDSSYDTTIWEITHWQPLPPPPEAEK
jgi:hypothetical protein